MSICPGFGIAVYPTGPRRSLLRQNLRKDGIIGLEYHVDAGKLSNLASRAKRTETACLPLDSQFVGQKINLALGHGTINKSDRWAVRIGFEFDD